jgi:hypothetical protein
VNWNPTRANPFQDCIRGGDDEMIRTEPERVQHLKVVSSANQPRLKSLFHSMLRSEFPHFLQRIRLNYHRLSVIIGDHSGLKPASLRAEIVATI